MEHYFTNNQNLRSELRTIDFENNGVVFTFFSDLGVFAKDYIDYGSKVLVETILKKKPNCSSILDVGCGYGFIGIVLGRILNVPTDLVDVNKRAIHLCEKNIEKNQVKGRVFFSDAYESVSDSYDLIVTNPPIRAGKKTVLKILREASTHLNKDGNLWFVIRKDQGVKSIMKEISDIYLMEVVKKDKGFYVVCAKMIDNK